MPTHDERDLFGFKKPTNFANRPVPHQANPAGGPRIRPNISSSGTRPAAAPQLPVAQANFTGPGQVISEQTRKGFTGGPEGIIKEFIAPAILSKTAQEQVFGASPKAAPQPASTPPATEGRLNVVDIGGTKRFFYNDQDAMNAAAELDAQQRAPQAPQVTTGSPGPGSSPRASSARGGEVNIIRGTQQFVQGADGTERMAGISDPRIAELMAARDSAIRNRPRNAYNPSSVPSPEASMASADKMFGDSLAFVADGERNATEIAKANIAANARLKEAAARGSAKGKESDASKFMKESGVNPLALIAHARKYAENLGLPADFTDEEFLSKPSVMALTLDHAQRMDRAHSSYNQKNFISKLFTDRPEGEPVEFRVFNKER